MARISELPIADSVFGNEYILGIQNGSTKRILIESLKGAKGDPSGPFLGEWVDDVYYSINDIVTYNGSSFIAISSSVNEQPQSGMFWNVLAKKGDPGLQGEIGLTGNGGADLVAAAVNIITLSEYTILNTDVNKILIFKQNTNLIFPETFNITNFQCIIWNQSSSENIITLTGTNLNCNSTELYKNMSAVVFYNSGWFISGGL
jgi:hypothetical protein